MLINQLEFCLNCEAKLIEWLYGALLLSHPNDIYFCIFILLVCTSFILLIWFSDYCCFYLRGSKSVIYDYDNYMAVRVFISSAINPPLSVNNTHIVFIAILAIFPSIWCICRALTILFFVWDAKQEEKWRRSKRTKNCADKNKSSRSSTLYTVITMDWWL